MEFDNVPVPEGINVSRRSPVFDLFLLSAATLLLLAGLAAAALLLGSTLARHMPVSWENALASGVATALAKDERAGDREVTDALQRLADRLTAAAALPEGMRVTVHYLDDKQVNAMATLGGHVFVFRGLIERMPNENALAMVLAHEIGHVANRDAVAGLGGVVLMQLGLAVLFGSSPGDLEQLVYGQSALLLKSFGRDAERRADHWGLAALAATYGHLEGASTIFEIFRQQGREPPEILSTHPLSEDRLAAIERRAAEHGWPIRGATRPLAPPLARLVERAAKKQAAE